MANTVPMVNCRPARWSDDECQWTKSHVKGGVKVRETGAYINLLTPSPQDLPHCLCLYLILRTGSEILQHDIQSCLRTAQLTEFVAGATENANNHWRPRFKSQYDETWHEVSKLPQ